MAGEKENEKDGQDKNRLGAALHRQDKSRSRSRSRLGVSLRPERRKSLSVDVKAGGDGSAKKEEVKGEFLPPLRPPSPLWAGSFGKVRPYSYSLVMLNSQTTLFLFAFAGWRGTAAKPVC